MANKNPNRGPSAGRAARRSRSAPRPARRARAGAASAPAPAAAFDPLSAFPPAPPPQDDAHLLKPRALSFGGQPYVVRPLGPADEGRLISFFNSHTGETIRRLHWASQLALSLLWSTYAGLLTAAGFRARLRAVRSTGLVVFGFTLAKVLLFDISELRQFYRIVALLALGIVLLGAAWIYQRGLRREQTR